MTHIALGIVLVGMVMVFGWVMFFLWIIMSIVRGVLRGVGMVLRSVGILPARKRVSARPMLHCTHYRCGAPNPVEAKFCRRCGSSLACVPTAQYDEQPNRRFAAYA